ncbi:LysR family transcriptional regulator [Simiduia agarivorans]|uniref:LysR family transcriptional regulator n=1 Tax=Simiduia agarivorans (strain DSM 21679 / JCM 13881 / BCRC 17597 / SA1) TaxID=1117647 RepID=K4KGN3_SIMAS|nr:LysR family transcriptional regulator [Simiduia agarivorans]AFU98249.1 LysR family transcriptional regulator [Simiduia agarivorans SA1 = DSM 21679]
MDLEAVTWFVAVVRTGSFNAAAKHLKQPASNVSRRIAQLERALGYRLLQRTTRALSLTPEGESLLPIAQSLCNVRDEIEAWRDSHTQAPTGRLRVTAPVSFARGPLTAWLIDYRRHYPQVAVELLHGNEYLDFQAHQLDFAFRQGPLPDSSLIARRLFGIHYGVYAAPELIARGRAINEPGDLTGQPVVAIGVDGRPLPWRFRNQDWVPEKPALMLEDPSQCVQAAEAGLGYTYISEYDAIPAVSRGSLAEVLAAERAPASDFYLVYSNREYHSKKNSAFLALVLDAVAQLRQTQGVSF